MEGKTQCAKIEVKNLTMRFDSLTVLDKIHFSVNEGELVSIVGPTGCGKTTFLNCLSGLTAPTAGEILIDGEKANPRKHNLAFVFQESTCLPWRSVRENVAFGMEAKGVPRKERLARADAIMEMAGLLSCADLYPKQVSASMLQRIAVSRAFAVHPDLLLLDEPYGQLDVKLRIYLEDELVKLWKNLKSTIIFITHNIEEAVYISQRVIVLSPKPTTVKADIPIDLPMPRSLISPEFIKLRKQITDLIRWW